MGANDCPSCHAGVDGFAGIAEGKRLASIETMMSCGCGGYVDHGVLHCTRCGRYFLTADEDHWPPSTADLYIFEIDRAEAEAILASWKKCLDIDNRNCGCAVHRESEHLHRTTKGVRRFFKAYPQQWDS